MSRRRSTRSALALSVALATGAATLTGVALTSSATAAPGAVPAALVPVQTLTSLLGTHAWYAQTFHGLPVLDSYYAIHRDRAGIVTSVADGRLAVPATLATSPRVTAAAATTSAASAVTAAAASAAKAVTPGPAKNRPLAPSPGQGKATLAVLAGAHPALVWSVITEGTDGESRTLVDATTGAVREITGLSKNATGKGKVFDPNPVVALRNENITDKNDADQAVLNPAYKTLALGHLGAGPTLVGTYARIVQAKGGLASSANHQYLFTRSSDKFEQVNAYYGIDTTQTYIQSLGFTNINNESQDLLINTITIDNSFYSPSADTITFGAGGVDDAEDLEVVWHEYGHAIQDAQVPGYGTSEQAGSIGEGFGDYWGATMSVPTSKGFDLPCLMDWDSTSYTSAPHCIRRTDTKKTTADIVGEVHADGEIWSGALWTIHTKLGRQKANTLVLESQFSFTPGNSFAQAATTTVNTARALYGNAVATTVRQAFVARKIL